MGQQNFYLSMRYQHLNKRRHWRRAFFEILQPIQPIRLDLNLFKDKHYKKEKRKVDGYF